LLEAHCYLRAGGRRIDVTTPPSKNGGDEPIERFLHEEEIDPHQITQYKIGVHKKMLKESMAQNASLTGFSLEEVWAIRERCIASLSQ